MKHFIIYDTLYDCLLNSMAWVQSVDYKAVFVCYANAHRSEWLELVCTTNRHGRYALDFCNLSGCEQLTRSCDDRCPWHGRCGRWYSTRHFRSLICQLCASCKHRTNRDCVHIAVRSFTWNTILKSTDPLVASNRAIGEVIGRYIPATVLCSRSVDMNAVEIRRLL